MFRGLINDAKSAVSSVILKYVARASIAVPFIIAIGFGIAALTTMLVQHFGAISGYLMVGGGFAVIGIVAALAEAVREHEEEAADKKAEQVDTNTVASDATVQAALQAPLAILGALFSTPLAPTASLKALRVLGRNLPLVVLLVLIGALFWPRPEERAEEHAGAGPEGLAPRRHNGAHSPYGEQDLRT
jgi:hypothetical protein